MLGEVLGTSEQRRTSGPWLRRKRADQSLVERVKTHATRVSTRSTIRVRVEQRYNLGGHKSVSAHASDESIRFLRRQLGSAG